MRRRFRATAAADGARARVIAIHGGTDGGDASEELDAGEAENGQRSMLPFRSSRNRGGAGGNDSGELVLRRWRWFTVTKRNEMKRMEEAEEEPGLLRSGGCAGWVDDGIQGSTSEEEVLGRRLGVELLSIRIKEGAGGRAL
ncbi:hypothetical protein CFC21_001835 [Triticum aestivum]|uniref:Uncharacterized protein n=1 Tax=Triticum aestivum TaxID=4565 RepID=A0A3B5XYS9_WHEAT|nr:hypothetical protein CFC21_001834 [Triticum aestivum]KAF6983705.1 hypothetical protein CFC21_001835 [Triticum aestivum]